MIRTDRPLRRRRHAAPAVATSLVLGLALALAGCPAPEETPSPGPPGDPPSPADRSPDGIALEETCANREFGVRVAYPAGWVVNPANGLPPCSAFDPEDASMPAAGEIPRDIAIVIHRHRVPFQRTTDFDADPSVEVISSEETTVGGRRAVVAELQHTGQGMYPDGDRQYGYYVDLESHTLMAVTHGIDAADPPSYQERLRILDAMMASLRFQGAR